MRVGDTWETPPAWYSKFKGSYPPMGKGFPRSYIDQTPEEVLYDPSRVLGAGMRMNCEGPTVLRQPRLETTLCRQIGDLVQIREGSGEGLRLNSLFLENPATLILTNLALLGFAVYTLVTAKERLIQGAAVVGIGASGYSLLSLIADLNRDPSTAYQQTKVSLEV